MAYTNCSFSSVLEEPKDFDNHFGFLTGKDFYYMTVYKNSGDIEKAREIRNEYRKKTVFLLPDT